MLQYLGLPENYNPFLIVFEEAVDDDSLVKVAPDYFWYDYAGDVPCADPQVKAPILSQEKAEELVRKLVAGNPKVNFAVKEGCAHIIPADLRSVVRVVKVRVYDNYRGAGCLSRDCYYLEK